MNTGDRIKEALPATRPELCVKLGLSTRAVWKWVNFLRKAKEIHIGRYVRTTGAYAAVLHLGKGPDVKRPQGMTHAQKSARYRANLKARGAYDAALEKRRAQGARSRKAKKASKPTATFAADPLMALFYKRKGEE